MAQWSRDVIDIRCLGTIAGLVGAIVGFFFFAAIAGILNVGPVGSIVMMVLGIPIGYWLGVRAALGYMAR